MVPANTPPYKIDHSGDMKKNAGPKIAPKMIDKLICKLFLGKNRFDLHALRKNAHNILKTYDQS